MVDTYCDSDELEEHILNFRPSKDGLFPHELAVISYAKIGQICAVDPAFSGVFSVKLKITYPVLLLMSLIERGFISRQYSIEYLQFYRTGKLQEFAKKRGLKHPNNRDKMIGIITEVCSEEEIDNELPLSFYLPTENGLAALENAKYDYSMAYSGWDIDTQYFTGTPLRKSQLKTLQANAGGIDVFASEEQDWNYYYVVSGIRELFTSTVLVLPKRSSLTIRKNDHVICTIQDVDVVNIYYQQKRIAFRTLENPATRRMVPAHLTCLDLISEKIDYRVFDEGDPWGLIGSFEMFAQSKCHSKYSIKERNQIVYYVSVKDRIASLLLSSFMTPGFEAIEITSLDNYLDDQTNNVMIAVPQKDQLSRNLIQYLVSEKRITEVSVFGSTIRELAYCLYCQDVMKISHSKSTYEYYREDLLHHKECLALLSDLKQRDPELKQLEEYIWKFPLPLFNNYGVYRHYDAPSVHENDKNWLYAKEHCSELCKETNRRTLDLRERGIIPTRWINEFNLYLIVKNLFPDTIYQYRTSWLKQQSLDIYIPSKRVGIEYQGIQHYEAVEIFGGEEGLLATQERDMRKATACEENNIRLIKWDYTADVTENNVMLRLKRENILDM